MTAAKVGIEKRLRMAGVLLIVGLLVEAICLQWARPIAFILAACYVVAGLLCISIRWSPPARPTSPNRR